MGTEGNKALKKVGYCFLLMDFLRQTDSNLHLKHHCVQILHWCSEQTGCSFKNRLPKVSLTTISRQGCKQTGFCGQRVLCRAGRLINPAWFVM